MVWIGVDLVLDSTLIVVFLYWGDDLVDVWFVWLAIAFVVTNIVVLAVVLVDVFVVVFVDVDNVLVAKHVEQLNPVHSFLHEHINPWLPTTLHIPLFWHGLGKHGSSLYKKNIFYEKFLNVFE